MCKKLVLLISLSLVLLTSNAFGALEYHYPLDEAAGSGTVTDSIKSMTGVLFNGSQMGAVGAGGVGGAAQFGATYTSTLGDTSKNDYINIVIPHLTAREGGVAFFAQMQDSHYWNYMFGIKDNSAGTDRMQVATAHRFGQDGDGYSGDYLGLGLGDDWDKERAATPLGASGWHHIAVSWSDPDGDGSGDYVGYRNGDIVASGTYSGLVALVADADIGADGDGHQKGIKGLIDEVYLWSHTVTQAEIRALPGVPEPATIALLGLGGLVLLRRKRR